MGTPAPRKIVGRSDVLCAIKLAGLVFYFDGSLKMINEIALKDIEHRAENGTATNKDCLDLIEYIGGNIASEEFLKRVEVAVDGAFENIRFDAADIVSRIIRDVKK